MCDHWSVYTNVNMQGIQSPMMDCTVDFIIPYPRNNSRAVVQAQKSAIYEQLKTEFDNSVMYLSEQYKSDGINYTVVFSTMRDRDIFVGLVRQQ